MKLGAIIALHSYKGGTGKTILSVNLAAILKEEDKGVCLLDFDFRAPSLHILLKVGSAEYWLNDFLEGKCDIKDALVDMSEQISSSKGKLLVGLANPSPDAIRKMSAKSRRWEMRSLGRLLSIKSPLFNDMKLDYLILDTSPGLQYSSINAIVSSDIALVVATTEASDVDGTRRMIHDLYDLFDKRTEIVLNKVPIEMLSSKKEKGSFFRRFNDLYNLPIIGVIPCFCDVLAAGGNYIFTQERPQHPFTEVLNEITQKIESRFLPPAKRLPDPELLRRYKETFLKKVTGIYIVDEESYK